MSYSHDWLSDVLNRGDCRIARQSGPESPQKPSKAYPVPNQGVTQAIQAGKNQPQAAKRSKYGNVKTWVQGIKFDSKKEAERYLELRQLLKEGKIENLRCQPTFPLFVNGLKVCEYKADFTYWLIEACTDIVEDVKSPASKTAVYRLKKKLMKACLNIDILET